MGGRRPAMRYNVLNNTEENHDPGFWTGVRWGGETTVGGMGHSTRSERSGLRRMPPAARALRLPGDSTVADGKDEFSGLTADNTH